MRPEDHPLSEIVVPTETSPPPVDELPTPAPDHAADEPATHPPEESAPSPHAAETDDEPNEAAEAAPAEAPKSPNMHWYCVKVQSGREETIKEAIERRVKIEGLEEFFGQIVIPTEKVTEITKGKRVTRERKKLPGYFMAQVEFNDAILYLFRETSGVGDFVGGSVNRKPTPMTPAEVSRWLDTPADTGSKTIHVTPKYVPGDRVRIKDDTFKDMEGEVKELIEEKNLVRVEVVVLGRPVSVELEYWQVEPV